MRLVAACLAACLAADADAASVSGTAAFSRLDAAARGPALGGGITALDDGPAALAANPAGLARLQRPAALLVSGASLPLARSLQYAAVAGWVTGATALGLSVMLHGAGADVEYRRANTEVPDSVQEASSQAYTFGAGWRIFPPMEFGASFKLLLDSVGSQSAWGISGDLGLVYHPVSRAAFSFAVSDAGGSDLTAFNWTTEAHEEYARTVRAGAAVDLNPLVLVAEGRELGTARASYGGGVELDLLRPLTARIGVDGGRLAAGFGARVAVRKRAEARVDYAWVREPFGPGAYAHRVALTVSLERDTWPRGQLAFPTESPVPPAAGHRPPRLFGWPGL